MRVKNASKTTSPIKSGKRNITVIALLSIIAIVIALVLAYGFSTLLKTSTYYVLNTPVAAKTEITTGMLSAQTTSAGTQPSNALSIQQVQSGKLYAKYALQKGDVIARSNVGALNNNSDGIPDSWVTTSFSAPASDTINGRITRGTYFDIIGVSSNNKARYLFTDVLALQVDGGSSDATSKNDASSYQYTVGMPQASAPLLQAALKEYPTIKLVLSPKSVSYGKRDTAGLGNTVTFSGNTPNSQDLYQGTDPSFNSVKRNKQGKPFNQTGNPALKSDNSNSK